MKEKFRDEGTISPLPLYKTIITWILRLAVGGIFIFSGFVKGIDPWGTLYKMQDYVNVMPLPALSDGVLLTGVFLLFALEFLTGVFLEKRGDNGGRCLADNLQPPRPLACDTGIAMAAFLHFCHLYNRRRSSGIL